MRLLRDLRERVPRDSRGLAAAAMVGALCVASIAACDDARPHPSVAPLAPAVPPAQESKDPRPAKPPGLIDNTVGADAGAADADAGREAGALQ